MVQRRNRRAGVEDRWQKTVRRSDGTSEQVESAAHGVGKRWRGRYVDNKGQEHARGFERKVDAQRWVNEATTGLTTGGYVQPRAGDVTVGTLGAAWLARQTHLKPSAYRPVEIAWRVHVKPRWADTRIADIAFTSVQQWVSEMSGTRGATTVIRAYGVLAATLDDAVRDKLLLSNPARGVVLPRKSKKRHVYLTHEQVDRLAIEAKDNGTLVLTLAYCGLRWGEATGMRVRDLDLLRRRVTVYENAVMVGGTIIVGTPKSGEERTVPIPRFLVEALARKCEGKGPEDLLFPGRDGNHARTPYSVDGWFAGAVSRAKLPRITPHGLRHTAASLAVSSGANVKAVQRMLGHASAAMTLDVYADLFDGDLDDVADRLDKARTKATADVLRTRRLKTGT